MSRKALSRSSHIKPEEPLRPRVLVADEHELVARGIERVLGDGIDVVGVVTNSQELLPAALRLKPQVVVIDVGAAFLDNLEAARRLHNSLPAIKLLFIAQYADRESIEAAFRTGGQAYLLKQSAASEIHDAMTAILKGKLYLSASLGNDLVPLTELRRHPVGRRSGRLTPRKREVLQLVAEGKTAKEIAQLLNISHKTVEFHKGRIMETLGLKSIAELTRYALERRIIPMRHHTGN